MKKTKRGAVQVGALGDFGLGAALVTRGGSASLTATVKERCEIAMYDFDVRYTVGVPPVKHKPQVPVKIIADVHVGKDGIGRSSY